MNTCEQHLNILFLLVQIATPLVVFLSNFVLNSPKTFRLENTK